MIHELKIQKQWADAKLAGEKPFEIRRNDRGFQKGDTVRYKVIDPKTGAPWTMSDDEVDLEFRRAKKLGRTEVFTKHPLELCDFVITYVREGADGLEKGYCVYADQPVPKRPVSADLGSGATPSNGTAEPLAPPLPLADTPDKDVHTDGSVPKAGAKCNEYVSDSPNGMCQYTYRDGNLVFTECRCEKSPNFGKTCVMGNWL